MNCCYKCFDEAKIQEYVKGFGEIGDCDFCESEDLNICEAEELGMFIREGFFRAYEHVENFTGAMWDSEQGMYIGGTGEATGESIFEILNEKEMIFSDIHDSDSAEKLLEHLISESGPDEWDKADGANDPLEDIYSPSFVTINDLYKSEATEEFHAWKKFKHTCKYYNRYFDLGNENSSRMNLLNSLRRIFKLKSETIDKNQKLFRARKIEQTFTESENINWYKELGPAPAKYAANNRMSPSGISYTYLADNIQTTIQEIRAENEDKIILGEFRTKHELRVLDLSKEIRVPKLSIFDEEYFHNDNWLEDFILHFTEEISRPISNEEKDIEYIATQVLAEFIRKLEFDGIKFESSLVKGTFNYVLFCGPNPEFSREYYDFEYFEYRDLELPYFNEWLLLDNVTENQVYQEMSLKLLNEYKEIERLKEFNLEAGSSSKTFAKFTEALGYIKELEEYLKKTYNVKDVDLEMEIEGFIKEYPSKGTGYIILVQQGFHFITITIKRNLSFWEDQHSKQLDFIDKEKEKSFFGDSSPSIIDWDKSPF